MKEALVEWLGARVPALTPPLVITPVEGGRSNLTYFVDDADGRRWVLRRPPLHGVLESAHDVGREFRIMAALADTDVPVPTMVAIETDPAVIGAPFFAMDHVAGTVLRDAPVAEAMFTPAQRRALGLRVVETLATLHRVDPDAVGLGDLGRREAYAERQLRRWWRQWGESKTREQPLAGEVHRLLSARVPEQKASGIAHGDFRLDNLIIDDTGAVQAVLDWELCTLGDPLVDLGNSLAYWIDPGEPPYENVPTATTVAGFPTRDELFAHYADVRGITVEDPAFYLALGRWKVAVVIEGVHTRYVNGAMGTSGGDYSGFVRTVDRLLAEAHAALTA